MYQLHLGISEDLEQTLRAFAQSRGLSMAAAVRLILHTFVYPPEISDRDAGQPEEIQR